MGYRHVRQICLGQLSHTVVDYFFSLKGSGFAGVFQFSGKCGPNGPHRHPESRPRPRTLLSHTLSFLHMQTRQCNASRLSPGDPHLCRPARRSVCIRAVPKHEGCLKGSSTTRAVKKKIP